MRLLKTKIIIIVISLLFCSSIFAVKAHGLQNETSESETDELVETQPESESEAESSETESSLSESGPDEGTEPESVTECFAIEETFEETDVTFTEGSEATEEPEENIIYVGDAACQLDIELDDAWNMSGASIMDPGVKAAVLEKANTHPTEVIFHFGFTDIGMFCGDAEDFISAYAELITTFSSMSPETQITVQSICNDNINLQAFDYALLIPEFNSGMNQMCENECWKFIEYSITHHLRAPLV